MSGFSPEWLLLREPIDHRSRNAQVAMALAARFAGRRRVTVVDLGCGTGSNLRGSFGDLPPEQDWTLVDYDPRLLVAARRELSRWADQHTTNGDTVSLEKSGKRLTVRFRQVDLNQGLEQALGASPDLVTAAAFFDLASAEMIGHLARCVSERGAAFYTVLTYNGQQSWQPAHTGDRKLLEAFEAHQRTDKGLGPAAGPAAAPALAATFQAAGYFVTEGDSPWLLGSSDQRLIAELAKGFADAAEEAGGVPAAVMADWRQVIRTAAVVGHTDTLAVPEG